MFVPASLLIKVSTLFPKCIYDQVIDVTTLGFEDHESVCILVAVFIAILALLTICPCPSVKFVIDNVV